MSHVDQKVCSVITGALKTLEVVDGGPVLMNRVDTTDGCDSGLGDYVTILSTLRQLMGRLHYYNLILLFRNHSLNTTDVRTLMINHSKKMNASCDNVFLAMLHSYCFLDILTIFCKYKDLKEFNSLIISRTCLTVFKFVFKASFEINGGMGEFDNFVGTPDMDAIFDSVRSCYVEEGFFATPISTIGENKVYGENFKEPSEDLRQKILGDYLPCAPSSLKNNLESLAEDLESVTLPNSSEDLNMTERTDFSNLLNWHVAP